MEEEIDTSISKGGTGTSPLFHSDLIILVFSFLISLFPFKALF